MTDAYTIASYIVIFAGVVKLTSVALSFLSLAADLLVLPAVDYSKYGAGKGNWAVVTGASDGLGKQFALQLASKGFNIVLVSRTESKLKAVASEIKTETKIVAFDASTDDPANYTQLAKALKGLKVTVLVNNVGRSHSIPVSFLDTPEDELHDIMTINNTVTLKITRVVVPIILETLDTEKVRGLILTMGSFAGLFPTPMLATYSGSKFFLQGWSSALAGELKPQGIDVEIALSYLVTSAMSKVRRTSATIPDPEHFVASTLKNVGRRVGAQERYATSTPYWSHAIMHWAVDQSVGVFSKVANSINYTMHQSIRMRALKKAARKAKEQKGQ